MNPVYTFVFLVAFSGFLGGVCGLICALYAWDCFATAVRRVRFRIRNTLGLSRNKFRS